MKKCLVFSFYLFEGWKDSFANRVHLAYLKHYHDIFDKALFIIVCDDISNLLLIEEFEKEIVDIGFVNVEFRIMKNNPFREAEPFYEEVVKKMNDYTDYIVTWGHNKGVSSPYFYPEGLFNWLSVLYFGTMGLMKDCEQKMLSNYYGGEKYFYGALLVEGNGTDINWMYSGSFFNFNPGSILKAINRNGKGFPVLSNRAYAEEFPGELFGKDRLGSWRDSYLFHQYSNFYDYSEKDWEETFIIIFNGVLGDFNKTKNDIWSTLK